MSKLKLSLSAIFLSLAAAQMAAADEPYPNRTAELIVNAPAGGGEDIVTRLLAEQLSKESPQKFIVINKDGSTALVGDKFVAGSKPDGYVLAESGSEIVISPALIPDLGINVESDLVPITNLVSSPYVMVVSADVPANNPKELVEYIKQHDKEFRWGTPGIGTPPHIGLAQFDQMAGINPLMVPFTGTGPFMVSLLGGEVKGGMASASVAKSNIASGKIKALAMTTTEPSEWMPGLPTVASYGFPGYELSVWFGLYAPKGTPKDIVDKIFAMVNKAFASPELQAKYKAAGLTPTPSKSPEEFGKFMHQELVKTAEIVKNIQANTPH